MSMVFDLRAAKAYVGGILATAAPAVSGFVVGIVEASTGWDIPVSLEQTLLTGVAFVLGWVGVYFTPNRPMQG